MIEIKYVNKQPRDNAWERITHVGWVDANWMNWRKTQQEAVNLIDSKEEEFYVNVEWDKVKVITATSRFNNRYIKTESDGDKPNNLLFLPECPKKPLLLSKKYKGLGIFSNNHESKWLQKKSPLPGLSLFRKSK